MDLNALITQVNDAVRGYVLIFVSRNGRASRNPHSTIARYPSWKMK
ncbi:MAG: hypothetical protein IKD75_15475 [Prevotella sp.]|nr:hypothetical protein [Prevotella sp.]